MTEAIIVAALGLVGTLVGSYLANRKSTALIAYRLEQLEQKVSKHNKLVERTYALEERADHCCGVIFQSPRSPLTSPPTSL